MVRTVHFWPAGLRANPAAPVVPTWDERIHPSECRTIHISQQDVIQRLSNASITHLSVPVPADTPCRRYANRLRARLALLKATALWRWTVRVSSDGRSVDVRRVGRWPTLGEKAAGMSTSDLALPRIQAGRGRAAAAIEDCKHPEWVHHGYDRSRRQRLRCPVCYTTKLAEPARRRFGMYLVPEKMAALDLAFSAGLGTRASAKQASVAYNTALKYRLLVSDASLCPCGWPAGHRGWCAVRFKNPARQELLRRLHQNRKQKQESLL